MNVYAFDSIDWNESAKHGLAKEEAVAAVEEGLAATKKLLPTLSEHLNIVVRPYFQYIIPEYGTGARTWDSEFIEIWFDKAVPHGAEKTLESIRQTVFHEGYHAARWAIEELGYDNRLIAGAIFEGLATVFEREYANSQPLYGKYENTETMKKWFTEIRKAGEDWGKRDELFFDNPDGRRWIGYKTGTWLIDKAIDGSGKTIIDLITLPVDDIVLLAKLK